MRDNIKYFCQGLRNFRKFLNGIFRQPGKTLVVSGSPTSTLSNSVSGPTARPSEGARSTCSQDTFCVLAFNHLQLAPNGTAKMCCIANGDVHDDGGQPMTLYRHRYDEIWNSRYMREARRGMAAGEEISACTRCYHEERTVGTSRRVQMNAKWLSSGLQTKQKILAEAEANNWYVEARPTFLQLNLGNLCNLACRMCGSFYSSRIASDPVHNKWMPIAHIDVGRWREDRLTIGPRPTFGVRAEGFHVYEPHPDSPLRWSNGDGHLIFTLDTGTRVRKLVLQLRGAMAKQPFKISVNGQDLQQGTIDYEAATLEFDLTGLTQASESEFDIALTSEAITHPGSDRKLGVGLLEATVYREPVQETTPRSVRAFTRFDRGGGWWSQPDVVYGELLSQPNRLRRLIFQGGEPLLIREVGEIFEYLVSHDAAQSVTIELTSNLTVLSNKMLEVMKHFEKLEAGCSIDGIGADLEYIRYGAKWDGIQQNIRRIVQLPNARVSFNVVVQFYNLMRITDLYRYCDLHDIQVQAHFLVGPNYLSVLVMPPKARRVALQRLCDYLSEEGVLPANRSSAEYLVHFLEQHADIYHSSLIPTFMEFTNDMDVSRQQSFAAVHPDLVKILEESGHCWVNETRFAKPKEELVGSAT
jgi:MoaA/NifB/PqqE/SkfB family radical SAM enzyme